MGEEEYREFQVPCFTEGKQGWASLVSCNQDPRLKPARSRSNNIGGGPTLVLVRVCVFRD